MYAQYITRLRSFSAYHGPPCQLFMAPQHSRRPLESPWDSRNVLRRHEHRSFKPLQDIKNSSKPFLFPAFILWDFAWVPKSFRSDQFSILGYPIVVFEFVIPCNYFSGCRRRLIWIPWTEFLEWKPLYMVSASWFPWRFPCWISLHPIESNASKLPQQIESRWWCPKGHRALSGWWLT